MDGPAYESLINIYIIIHHLSESSGTQPEELASRVRALPHSPSVLKIRADIASTTGPKEIIEKLRAWREPSQLAIDTLVNNSGIVLPAALGDITADYFSSIISTNLQGPLLMVQVAAPCLAKPARIVNISSQTAKQPFRGLTVYVASKTGLEAMTRHLAHELGENGTTVNCVTPRAVDSGLLRETEKKIPGIIESICASTPLQHRVGMPEEFAGVVAWLCRADAEWMTGQTISATGGQAMY